MDNNSLNLGAGPSGSGSQPATQNPQNIGTANLLPAGTSSLQGSTGNSNLNVSGSGTIPLSNFQLSQDFDSSSTNHPTNNRWPLAGTIVLVAIAAVVIAVFVRQEIVSARRTK